MFSKTYDLIKRHEAVFVSALCAFFVLLFTTRSSFLFVCNNWDDVNSYFTMGKGMMNGMVIYRDLYDQKGPYLYLLYGIAYLISHKTFLGVFIFEVIAATIFLFFAYKLISGRGGRTAAIVLLPVLAAGVYSSWSFYKGGAAEEFCLPMFAYSLYALDSMLQDRLDDGQIKRAFAIAGICAGITAQVKYTMLGFYFGWFIVAVIYCVIKKNIRNGAMLAIRFILFAILPSIPWFIYFLATGSLDDWFRCYIYNNLFFYSKVDEVKQSLGSRLVDNAKTLLWLIEDSFSYFIFIIAGVFLQLILEKGVLKKFVMPFMFVLTYFVIFFGGNKLAYYSIPLMVFAIWGAGYIGQMLAKLPVREGRRAGIMTYGVFVVLLPLCTVFAANHCISAEYRKQTKDSFWLMEASQYLNEDDTLLNVNALDVGLYTVTGIVPTCEYFQTNGIGLPTLFEQQKEYLRSGVTDYVLAVDGEMDLIWEHYDCIKEFTYAEDGAEHTYFLYKKRAE